MKAYREAKLALFSPQICPIAIVNGDDVVGREIVKIRKEKPTCVYTLNTPSDRFAVITDDSLNGTECMLNLNDKLYRASLRMLGEYNVYNALAAASCAEALGFGEWITEGLLSVENVRGRLQRVGSLYGAEIYVDFAHTPDGLEKVLKTLKRHCKGRLVCLFGCGGNRDKSKRPKMGECAAKIADFTILTSDNPRYEDPLDILSNIEEGYRRYSIKYVLIPDREKAIEYALDFLKKDDVLLVAGKGGEDYQEVMGIKYSFNDQDIIEKILEKKGREWFS
jgi:UDP-N-acetylmuramyl-tripeptide synthetase